jgi:putative membrane protein
MISYNSKDWMQFIFKLHKSDTLRKLTGPLLFLLLYCYGICYLEIEIIKLGPDHELKNLTILHSLLGFVLSLLLVFRTNTAYDRWWEGRKLWGSLVNTSRNLALKINALLPLEARNNRNFFRKTIPLFSRLLKQHLISEQTRLELDVEEHPELKTLESSNHRPNQAASLLAQRIYRLKKEGLIDASELLTLNNELQSFTDISGACERIKNTPIPFSYSLFIKKFIFIYVVTLPIGFVLTMQYWAIPVTLFIFYALASLELIAEEIEDPFGADENDLPMEKIAKNIEKNVTDLLN